MHSVATPILEDSQTTRPSMCDNGEPVAQRKFEAFSDDQLSLEEGMIITMVQVQDDLWAYGKVGDKEGKFPRHAIKPIGALSAELSSPAAKYEMGLRLAHGIGGVPRNLQKGMEWHREAALSGSVMGTLALAWHYGQGVGVVASKERAQLWLGVALVEDPSAAATAFFHLGVSYEKGLGSEALIDAPFAFRCYKRAALAGHVGAMVALACCYQLGVGVAITPQEAFTWYKRAAELGNSHGEGRLGYCLYAGFGVRQDQHAAANYFREAAHSGDVFAQYMLGRCFKYGDGLIKDFRSALFWFHRAAQQGHVDAAHQVGMSYEYGWGSYKNPEEAFRWFKRSAEAGHAAAQAALGWKFALGSGVVANRAEAVHWTTLAAEQGEPMGQFNLAAFYQRGWGVEKDETVAAMWLKRATTKGYKPAVYELKRFVTWQNNARPVSPLQNRRSLKL